MKKISLYICTLAFTFLFLLQACKKDEVTELVIPSLSETVLKGPTDNSSINIDIKTAGQIVTFEWDAVKASDGNVVFYTVLIDKENGDFSSPLYKGTPAKLGSETLFSFSHKELNKIAKAAGIQELQTGKLKWKVVSTTGISTSVTDVSRKLEVTRPVGFAENPANVFLYGQATEAGTDLTKAVQFKKTSEGIFEVYTSLTAGTYKMVDKITGTPTVTFTISGSSIVESQEATSPATTPTVYRINLDFNKSEAILTQIQSVGLWFSGYNRITNPLIYEGNGVWKATDIPITWSQQSWGKDERYKFRISEKDMNAAITTKSWGGLNKDNGNRPTSATAATYYKLNPVDNSQWDYTYKFASEALKADVFVKFQSTGDYTHQIVYK